MRFAQNDVVSPKGNPDVRGVVISVMPAAVDTIYLVSWADRPDRPYYEAESGLMPAGPVSRETNGGETS